MISTFSTADNVCLPSSVNARQHWNVYLVSVVLLKLRNEFELNHSAEIYTHTMLRCNKQTKNTLYLTGMCEVRGNCRTN